MNHEYDLAKPLASALKASAPYVGIPIPGHAPLIFNRAKLKSALRGVKPVYIDVEVHENGQRSLVVEGVASARCRTSLRMRSLQRNVFYSGRSEAARAMDKWNPLKQRSATRTTKYEKAIAKLERQLVKLGNRPAIPNPCLASSRGDHYREEFLRWHRQKDLRRKIGRLAIAVRGVDGLSARELYVELAKLTTVKRYSDFTEKERERIVGKAPLGHNGFFVFADPRNLWKFLPEVSSSWMHARPRLYWGTLAEWQKRERKERWGAQRYLPVLNWLHERDGLLSQIAAVRAMTEPIPIGPAALPCDPAEDGETCMDVDGIGATPLECPGCGEMAATVPAEGIPNQSLRGCPQCGTRFFVEWERLPE